MGALVVGPLVEELFLRLPFLIAVYVQRYPSVQRTEVIDKSDRQKNILKIRQINSSIEKRADSYKL